MFWRIGWQQSSKRPQGLEGSCTYSMLLAIWCLQGTARSTGLGLGRVGFTLSPLRRYWCIPVACRSWASGSPSVSARFSDVAPAKSGAETDAVSSPEPQRYPRPGVRASFPALVRAVRSGSCGPRCTVKSLVLSLSSPRGAGSTVLPSLLGMQPTFLSGFPVVLILPWSGEMRSRLAWKFALKPAFRV